eukprot:5367281-Amphidinium_carterae.2
MLQNSLRSFEVASRSKLPPANGLLAQVMVSWDMHRPRSIQGGKHGLPKTSLALKPLTSWERVQVNTATILTCLNASSHEVWNIAKDLIKNSRILEKSDKHSRGGFGTGWTGLSNASFLREALQAARCIQLDWGQSVTRGRDAMLSKQCSLVATFIRDTTFVSH